MDLFDKTWWAVHFRKGRKIVQGEAEVAKHKARLVPKVVFVEQLTEYSCSACKRAGPWEQGDWCWVGRSDGYSAADAKVLRIFCSRKCRAKAAPDRGKSRRTWYWEPTPFRGERYREIHGARRAANPRLFPWPEYPKLEKLKKSEGRCRWCGERITSKYGYQRTAHAAKWGDPRDCKREMLLHIDRDVQTAFLFERDGPGCCDCPPGSGRWVDAGPMYPPERGNWIRWSEKLEVDHVIELWEVIDLPDDERRRYFGPDNLKLRCETHHKAKSKESAARRSAARRR